MLLCGHTAKRTGESRFDSGKKEKGKDRVRANAKGKEAEERKAKKYREEGPKEFLNRRVVRGNRIRLVKGELYVR